MHARGAAPSPSQPAWPCWAPGRRASPCTPPATFRCRSPRGRPSSPGGRRDHRAHRPPSDRRVQPGRRRRPIGAARRASAPPRRSTRRPCRPLCGNGSGGGSRLLYRDAGFRNVMVLAGGLDVDRSRFPWSRGRDRPGCPRHHRGRLGLLLAGRPAESQPATVQEQVVLENDTVRVSLLVFPGLRVRRARRPGSGARHRAGGRADPLHAGRARGAGLARLRWLPALEPDDARNEGSQPLRLWVVVVKR